MGLFSRRNDPERERARAIASRGVQTVARVMTMRDGDLGGPGRQVVLELAFTPTGLEPVEVEVTQRMDPVSLTGLEPGVDALISYDRDDPSVVVVWHAAHVRIVDGIAVAAPAPPPAEPADGSSRPAPG